MERSEIAIIIPAYNEALTIQNIIQDVEKYGDVLVVDDCSTDKTVEAVKESKATLLSHERNLGYEKALSTGIDYAFKKHYKYAITSDADGELIHTGIESIIKSLEIGYLLVIGKRKKKNRLIEYMFGFFTFALFKVNDPLCGMKGYNKEIYERYGSFDTQGMIGTEILALSIRDAIKIKEVPIDVTKREGTSRFGGRVSSFFKIMRVIFIFFGIIYKIKNI